MKFSLFVLFSVWHGRSCILGTLLFCAFSGLCADPAPDISTVPADLRIPELTDGAPGPGKRVRFKLFTNAPPVVLYLPSDWSPERTFPVIVELAGNGNYKNAFGDISTGIPEGSNLGYGLSGGRGYVWVCLPFLNDAGDAVATTWWGNAKEYNPDSTVAFIKRAVPALCARFSGDPGRVMLCGFSRGSIAANAIGLHDEEISRLWRAFVCYSNYDGVREGWPFAGSDRPAARTRLARLAGRPQLICHESATGGSNLEATRCYLDQSGITGDFTFLETGFRNHNDGWVLRPSSARDAAREWLSRVLREPAGSTVERPLDEILFCERHPGRDYSGHYYANFGYDCGNETYWLHGADGGRLAIYSPMTGSVRTLLEDTKGAVRDPQIHFDGKKVLFSYRKGGTHHYNLYEMNLDGTNLRQITQGDWDDVEPAYLPDGGIVFCSTRCKRYVLCWLAPVAVLFRCNADGSGLRQLSSGNVSENTPAVLPDGRILFTRWEYVNRDAVSFHHLWTMNPDGTGVMVYYGNMHPGGVFIDAQPIPNTANVVFIDSGYHGQREHAGKLMMLSLHNGPDDRSQAKALSGNGFRDPYPLADQLFLAARDNEIVTVTTNGVVKTLWKGNMMVHEPRPLRPRPRPLIIPSRVDLTQTTGTLMLTDVYVGRNMAGIKPGSIKKLLVMEDLPKPVNFHGGGTTPLAHGGSWTFKRILGTVPVEADGSAKFEIPAGRSIYFAALDANDLCVKQMRSFVTVQPGEQVSCIGCHENRTITANAYPGLRLAHQRAPSQIQPFVGIPEILDFPRDIQPILDRHCLRCHDTKSRKGGLVLSGDRGPTYSLAYYNLLLHRQIQDHAGLKWQGLKNISGRPGGNDAPYSAFSYAAPLRKHLEKSHHEVELSEVERTTLRLWLDSATPYAGTAAAFGTGQIGGWWRNNEPIREMADAWPTTGPAKDAMQRRCTTCHESRLPRFVTDLTTGDPFNDFEGWERPVSRFSRHTIFNLTHPEQSLALRVPLAKTAGGFAEGALSKVAPVPADLSNAPKPVVHGVVFSSTDDPDYQVILAHLQAARDRLNTIKRFDMPGFKPGDAYIREMKRYGILPSSFDPEKQDINTYEIDRKYWQQFWCTSSRPTK